MEYPIGALRFVVLAIGTALLGAGLLIFLIGMTVSNLAPADIENRDPNTDRRA